MILKLLLMALMIWIMWFFFSRKKNTRSDGSDDGNLLPISQRHLGIGIGVIVTVVAGLIFALKWQSDQKIIVLTVESPNETITYKARQKDIRERSFVTLDGLEISLGDDDRLVITR